MKKRALLSLLALALYFIGCKKDSPDYRDDFVGRYVGIRTNSSWILGQPGSSTETEDTVLVSCVGDSSLLIDATEVQIDADGQYFLMPWPSNYYSVRFFAGDSMEIDQNSGGLGGGSHSHFIARRS